MYWTDALTEGLREIQPATQPRACCTTDLFGLSLTFPFAALVLDLPLDSCVMNASRWSESSVGAGIGYGLASDTPTSSTWVVTQVTYQTQGGYVQSV